MKDSIHKYFQVGTITWMSYPGAAQEETIRKIAADDYFDAVEVCAFPDKESRERVRQLDVYKRQFYHPVIHSFHFKRDR